MSFSIVAPMSRALRLSSFTALSSHCIAAPRLSPPTGRRGISIVFSALAHSSNIDKIRQEFKKQAQLYSVHPSPIGFLMSEVKEVSGQALDVAAGTGGLSLALAPKCDSVIAFDACPEMLERAEQKAAVQGIENCSFVLGDAASLPFEDDGFDLVTSRLGIKHFPEASVQVSEMVRVCKPGGLVVLSDIVASDDPALHAEQDRLETLCDSSHEGLVTLEGLHALLEQTGEVQLKPRSEKVFQHPQNAEDWMKLNTTPSAREEILACFDRELKGGLQTGMAPYLDENGVLWFRHRYAVAQAIKDNNNWFRHGYASAPPI